MRWYARLMSSVPNFSRHWKIIMSGLSLAVAMFFFAVANFETTLSQGTMRQASDSPNRTISKISSEREESTPTNIEEGQSIRIVFGGDIMLDRHIRTQSEKIGKSEVFSGVSGVLRLADIAVANLEGAITLNASKSVGSSVGESRHFLFTFDPDWATILFENNIRLVNVGNNHILNFGESGLSETRKHLHDAGVKFFGDPIEASFRSFILPIKGKRIGFVNYNQFFRDSESRTLSDIEAVRSQADIVFVYAHWGAEYLPPTSEEKRLAHLFVDRGVDAVIGSHPHIVQDSEVYHGKTIYYSLGNFIFDQYFTPEVKRGLLVEANISSSQNGSISFRQIPVELLPDGRTVISKQ